MELTTVNSDINSQVIPESEIIKRPNGAFIEANTKQVSLEHLKKDCIIPVFARDNETTISHYEFIDSTYEIAKQLFPAAEIETPDIRVSHIIKGRVPSAIGKPAKELLEHEKTLYYERCAFVMEMPSVRQNINGNELKLCVGGVRAYNQENLYSKKSLEKFKLFIGFQNKVCTNLCISTDGFSNEIRIGSISELEAKAESLFKGYCIEQHLEVMESMEDYGLTEEQFAHFMGKVRMYGHLSKPERKNIFPIGLSDSQINHVVKDYYSCPNFKRNEDGSISLWNLYNLLTEANKSSYIDSNLERNVNAYELTQNLSNSIQNNEWNWFVHH
ncbi:DUF3871 family protein [Seonamhaeicola sp. ML3]|uniref:DUF3871 family protein n=1 Tax=Seonamhaeicola sp. ML3 TaxID=2937786 RepID=UPI00200BAC00|nr:DUF3871 family protein [Seonamhaeicola sp. ML3]